MGEGNRQQAIEMGALIGVLAAFGLPIWLLWPLSTGDIALILIVVVGLVVLFMKALRS